MGERDVLIQMQNIGKVFYADEVETHALSGVHLEIMRGEYVSISGPSGCGKSTLLSILGLLDNPSSGHYRLNDQAVEAINSAQRAFIRNREIGFIFQAFNLIGDMTVVENVELPLTYRDGIGRRERRDRAVAALEQVDMAHRLGTIPPSCPAASNNGWLWPAPWWANPRYFWPTNLPAIWTPRTASR